MSELAEDEVNPQTTRPEVAIVIAFYKGQKDEPLFSCAFIPSITGLHFYWFLPSGSYSAISI